MSSEISTEAAGRARGGRLQAWHLYLLLAMAGATWAVVVARETHPAALILLSAAVLAAGAVGIAVHAAVMGFLGEGVQDREPLDRGTRLALEQEKAIVLRSIKELEFDRAMGKVGDGDFAEIDARLRARALAIMGQLEEPAPEAPSEVVPSAAAPGVCASCGVQNDRDARFCKSCGQRLADV